MATLKISDLSVGDWVLMNGEPAKALRLTMAGRTIFKGLSGQIYGSYGGDISPLPIVPDILEANGIHRTYEDDSYAIFKGDGLWAVKYSDGDWELSTPPVCRIDIKYIHQLQHALRLAGVEKEIVMPKK